MIFKNKFTIGRSLVCLTTDVIISHPKTLTPHKLVSLQCFWACEFSCILPNTMSKFGRRPLQFFFFICCPRTLTWVNLPYSVEYKASSTTDPLPKFSIKCVTPLFCLATSCITVLPPNYRVHIYTTLKVETITYSCIL